MKAIWYIFIDYFRQKFPESLGMIAGFGVLIIAHFLLDAERAHEAFQVFFFGGLMLTAVVANHTKFLNNSSSHLLLPNYKRYQLIVNGIFLILTSLWPAILLTTIGMPFLQTFSMFFITGTLILRTIYRFGDNILVLFFLAWLLRFIYEILGFPVPYFIVPLITEISISPLAIEIPLCIIAPILLVLYMRQVATSTEHKSDQEMAADFDPLLRELDRPKAFTLRVSDFFLKRLFHKMKNAPGSLSTIIDMAQFSLFSPGVVVYTNTGKFALALVYMISIFFILYGNIFDDPRLPMPAFILSIIQIATVILATDFIQHRGRCANLWLWLPAATRSRFTAIILGTFIVVLLKHYLVMAIVLSLILKVVAEPTMAELLHILLAGFVIASSVASIALILSEAIISPEGRGWYITNMFVWIASFSLYLLLWENVGMMLLVIGLFVQLPLWAIAYKRWEVIDLDFKSPGRA